MLCDNRVTRLGDRGKPWLGQHFTGRRPAADVRCAYPEGPPGYSTSLSTKKLCLPGHDSMVS